MSNFYKPFTGGTIPESTDFEAGATAPNQGTTWDAIGETELLSKGAAKAGLTSVNLLSSDTPTFTSQAGSSKSWVYNTFTGASSLFCRGFAVVNAGDSVQIATTPNTARNLAFRGLGAWSSVFSGNVETTINTGNLLNYGVYGNQLRTYSSVASTYGSNFNGCLFFVFTNATGIHDGANPLIVAGDEITLCDAAGTGGSQFKFYADGITPQISSVYKGIFVRNFTNQGIKVPSTSTDTHFKINGGAVNSNALTLNSATNTSTFQSTPVVWHSSIGIMAGLLFNQSYAIAPFSFELWYGINAL